MHQASLHYFADELDFFSSATFAKVAFGFFSAYENPTCELMAAFPASGLGVTTDRSEGG